MPKIPFDPPTLSRKDIPALLLWFAGAVLLNVVLSAWMAQFIHEPFYAVSGMLAIGSIFAQLLNVLILRPARGMPPLVRKRDSDDFETWLGGNGFRLSRLRERYSGDELILVFGSTAVALFAYILWITRTFVDF